MTLESSGEEARAEPMAIALALLGVNVGGLFTMVQHYRGEAVGHQFGDVLRLVCQRESAGG